MHPNLPSQVISFCNIKRVLFHLFLSAEIGITFINTETSIPGFLRINFHNSLWNSFFLNHVSPCLGSFVASVMKDSVTTNLMSSISNYVPLNDLAKYFVISLWKPSNFSIKLSHLAFYNIYLSCGYPSINFAPTGSALAMIPMVSVS